MRRGAVAALAVTLAVATTAGIAGARSASAAPELPPVTPEELVASVLDAEPVALAGTVAVDNRLGLPAIPGAPEGALTDGASTARVWSDGTGRGRLALPRPDGERTYVRDGAVTWAYDSGDRTATRIPAKPGGESTDAQGADPQARAREIVASLRDSSVVTVDGTTEVAGRPAYTLVLAPRPGERTVLREVRAAVDAETRMPLELSVLGAGPEPVLRAGFDDVTVGPQDPALFTFTPPPGATVQDAPAREPRPDGRPGDRERPRTVGDGWDAVAVGSVPSGEGTERVDPAAVGAPVSGPWGSGHAITTAAGSAILTDDGRFAAGAVGTDVLGAALAR
ncbi:hypothetical protein AFB00_25040 [Pseudonocardia sp. HH130630-07]|nr:hypothetical protein AFB00_25040 [Pseudonocardia sp. HH130630-07]